MMKVVIFDMDGIVFDTEPIGFEATKKLFREYNKTISYEEIKPYFGRGARLYVQSLIKKHNVRESLDKLMKKRGKYFLEISKKKLRILPGIEKLINNLRKHKIKIALATSSSRKSVNKNCKITKLNKNIFQVITTRDDIKYLKPHPEIFIKTLKKLKVKPEACIVIEDSIAGIKAAKKAKIKTIAITNSFPKSKLKQADLIVSSAKQLTLEKLNKI